MSGQLKLIDGTSSVPGIAFNSEASSGIFRPASGMLALVASGVENLRINSAGRVLIGTTTDDGTNKLQINGTTKVTGALTASSFIGPLTGAVTGNVTGTVTGNVTGTATNVTGTVAIANGGTGATTAAAALTALGAVSKAGDSIAGVLTLNNGVSNALTVNGSSTFNYGFTSVGAGSLFNGGQAVSLSSTGYVQLGGTAGVNIVADYNQIQARSNGAASTLYLNNSGGLVQFGGALTSNSDVTGRRAIAVDVSGSQAIMYANSGNTGVSFYTPGGLKYIRVSGVNNLEFVNAGNSAVIAYLTDSGQFVANTLTQTSDDQKKKNWKPLSDAQLNALADMKLAGTFDWIDGSGPSVGGSAQEIRAIVPEAVLEDEQGNLTVNYGGLCFAIQQATLRRLWGTK
jgi:hypothetical protein